MPKAIRKLLKIGGYTIGSLLALFSAYLALLIFPGVLFANSVEFNNVTIYSNDDLSAVQPILESIDRALQSSEINDPTLDHKIFRIQRYGVSGHTARARRYPFKRDGSRLWSHLQHQPSAVYQS